MLSVRMTGLKKIMTGSDYRAKVKEQMVIPAQDGIKNSENRGYERIVKGKFSQVKKTDPLPKNQLTSDVTELVA